MVRSLSARSKLEYDRNDINSPRFFDAEKHLYSSVVSSGKSLRQLGQERDSLMKEINKLDSSMKELVSSNYTKFIDGSTLIREKTNNELIKMENDIGTLQEKMKAVNEKSEMCERRLGEGRNSLEVLVAAKPMMRKLLAVMALPRKIQTLENSCGDNEWEIYEDVIDDMKNSWPVLIKYSSGNEKLLQVYREMAEAKERIQKRLWKCMMAMSEQPGGTTSLHRRKVLAIDAADIAKLLVQLPDVSVEDVLEGFVTDRIALISSYLDDAKNGLLITNDETICKDAKSFLSEMDAAVLGEVAQTYNAFVDLLSFCKDQCESIAPYFYPSIEQKFNSCVGDLYNKYSSLVVDCSKQAAASDFHVQSSTEDMEDTYTFGSLQFTEFLQVFATDVSNMIADLFPNQPMTEIGCRLCEQVEYVQYICMCVSILVIPKVLEVELLLLIDEHGDCDDTHTYIYINKNTA